MSPARVLIAVSLAAALIVVAAILLRVGGSDEDSQEMRNILAFDPALVEELEVEYHRRGQQAQRERLVRIGPQQTWQIVWDGPDGTERSWPAAAPQVRSALRILSGLEGRAAEQAGESETFAAEVHITLTDGSQRLLRIGQRPLGGRVLAQAGRPDAMRTTVWLDRNIHEMFVGAAGRAGPRAWRDPGALPGAAGDVSRLTLYGEGGTLSLARIQGRWMLREPVAQPAEPEAIARLFSTLGKIRVADYLDGEAPEQTGVKEPVAVLALEADRRDPDDPSLHTTVRHTLAVGRTADLAGRNVFAHVRKETITTAEAAQRDYEQTLIVSGETLASIVMDPAAYIARRTIQAPSADIGFLTVHIDGLELRYQRTLDGWQRRVEGGTLVPLEREEGQKLAGTLQLLAQHTAAGVTIVRDEPDAKVATVELRTIGDTPIDEVALHITDEGRSVATVAGGIKRSYDAQHSRPVLEWLAMQHQLF